MPGQRCKGADCGGVHLTFARAERAGMIQCAAKTRYTVFLPRPPFGDDWKSVVISIIFDFCIAFI